LCHRDHQTNTALYVASRDKNVTDVISVTNFDDKFDAMKNK